MERVNSFIKRIIKKQDKLVPLSTWRNDGGETMVSIHCFVYNQEQYLSRCLDSFLKQLICFNVEILVHDDCSNDGSRNIIDSYHKRYPDLIKPVFEEKNVYSKTGNFLEIADILNKQSNGKYIAICEADDYWTDPLKLFLQTSILENYSKCNFCVHRVKVLSADHNYVLDDNQMPSFHLGSKLLDDKYFISLVNDKYNFQTSSYFFRKRDYDLLFSKKPLFMTLMPTDDEVLLRYFGSLGLTCFINRTMSTYIQFTLGSWSKEHKDNKDDSKKQRFLKAIEEFDNYSKQKYHKSCNRLSLKTKLFSYMELKKYNEIFRDKELRRTLREVDLRTYISLKIRRVFGKI